MILGNISRTDRKQVWWMTVAAATIVMLAGSFVVIALGSMGTASAAPDGAVSMKQAIALVKGSGGQEEAPQGGAAAAEAEMPTPTSTRPRHAHSETGTASFRINVNVADADQLALLPALGKRRAKAVIAWRSLHPFVTAADMMRVKGIGPAVFDKMSRFVVVEGPPVTGAPPRQTVRAPRPGGRSSGSRGA